MSAPFGQGFYLTADEAFAKRWARTRRDAETIMNVYDLDETGLVIKHFTRDEGWFNYIYANRNGRPDALAIFDMIIGPVANDTIYDLWGLTTGGLLTKAQSLSVLIRGPEYTQIALKTERAAAQLTWLNALALSPAEIARSREITKQEEAAYQDLFVKTLGFGE